MSRPLDVETPRDAAGSASGGNRSPQTSSSTSLANSPSSYARRRNSRKADATDHSLPTHSLPGDSVSPAAAASTIDEETSKSSLLIAVQLSKSCKEEGRRSLSERNISTASETQPSTSIEERSFHLGLTMATAASNSELPSQAQRDFEGQKGHHNVLKHGEGSVRWSLASLGAANRSRGGVHRHRKPPDQSPAAVATDSAEAGKTTVAIAETVPRIAQEQTSAAEAYAHRWSSELQRSTATEEELRQLYQQLEGELMRTRRAASAAEARRKRELDLLKRQLEQERTERAKAEQDREDLLSQATISASLTPRASDALPSSEQGGDAKGSRSDCNSTSSAHVSNIFHEKLKEREERARARVRKEFVREAQERLYAEQRRRAEAEKAAKVALQRLAKAEGDISKLQEAAQEEASVMEAKDVQLHERAIHVRELESHIHHLERQLAAAEDARRRSTELMAKNLEEAKALADQRQAELEAQRQLVHQLLEKIELSRDDRFDRGDDQEGLLRTMHELRARCCHLEQGLAAGVQQATALSQQRRERAEEEVQLLRGRNDELERRCAAVGAELAESMTRLEHVRSEMAQLRERSEKDISECRVEIRSLQLQLEHATKVGRRGSLEGCTAKEIEREQHAALLQYAAEARAAQEGLGRLKEQFHREKQRHLGIVLDLSQQITTLKQANTQLEHAVNVCTHNTSDSARLLDRAHQELSQLREERRRLSASLVDLREESRVSSAASSHDSLRRRIAELESVQRDLSAKLRVANRTARQLQSMQQATADQPRSGCALTGHHNRHGSPSSIFVLRTNSSSQNLEVEREKQRVADDEAASTPGSFMGDTLISASSRYREATTALPDLLESIAQQLQSITRDIEQQPDLSAQHNLPAAPSTLQQRRMQQTVHPEEREALDRVRVSCMAALECCHLRRTSSPFYPSFRDGAEERGSRRAAAAPSLVPSLVEGDRVSAARSRSSSVADSCRQRKQNYRDVAPQAAHVELPQDHIPQGRLERPRRSSQSSRVSFGDEDSLARFSYTSVATSNLPTEGTPRGDAAANVLPHGRLEQSPARKCGVDDSDGVRCIHSHVSVSVINGNREELPSESCWEDDEDAEAIERGERVAPPVGLPRSGSDTRVKEVSPARPRRAGAPPGSRALSGGSTAVSFVKTGANK
ncbi:hypothetical protein GH5_01477 [Leishmania sp. Ghana 2012 LV757]|uniref:hypothetical protein n=1 Tax=Leishmania sp. Ghana 2012 LV757 TaxID=2803181 RepID=UPI001B690E86|nr:hypothetical protein GH5_01477 [Leishmania sp. Ghana 2012 LV757]